MLRIAVCAAGLALAAQALVAPALAAALPVRVGQCAATAVKSIEARLVDGSTNQPIPDSGSAISFVNGGYQVSYDTIAAIMASRPGDPARLCLVSIPRGCPPGDARGRQYKTINLRTKAFWTLPDAEHACGGA